MIPEKLIKSNREENEYHPELLNIICVVPFARACTSTRMGMVSSMLAQTLLPKGICSPRTQTGALRELGNYTFKIEMPCDAEVLKIVRMYPTGIGEGMIKENPVTHLLYRDMEQNEIEYLELPSIHLLDKKFGFRYKYLLNPFSMVGKFIPKGTVIADSPAKLDNGEYCIGVQLSEVQGSFPCVTEDGCGISESAAEKLTFTSFNKFTVRLKQRTIPRNIYGTLERPQFFPNIGEYVVDGLLMALFRYDEETAPVEMTAENLMEVDYFYDECIYIQSEVERTKVVDIRIFKEGNGGHILPYGMAEQFEKYIQHSANSYKEIYDEYKKHAYGKQQAGIPPKVGRRLQMNILGKHFINEPRQVRDGKNEGKIVRTFSQAPIDGYRIEFVLESETVPTYGSKIAGTHGDKTIICEVWPDERMPMDEDGNVTEVLRDDDSTKKRQNPGLMLEGTLNASSRDFVRNLRQKVGLGRRVKNEASERTYVKGLSDEVIDSIWNEYNQFLDDLLPMMHQAYNDPRFKAFNKRDCITELLIQGHYSITPSNDPINYDMMLENCVTKYPHTHGPLRYIDAGGNVRVTRKPGSILSRYYILLDKVASDIAAVSSARLNHFGCPIRISNEDRYRTPIPESPIRLFAEYEHHMAAGIVGGHVMADINDQSSNPVSHREIITNTINADKPTAILNALDRRKIPLGSARPGQMIRHIKEGAGIGIYRMDDHWNWDLIQKRLKEEYTE